MKDKIKGADLRTAIYEIISSLSRTNKKCNEWYLRNDLSRKGYNNYDIYQALKFLKEKGAIYDIPYVDWFVHKEHRNETNIGDDALQKEIFTIIKNFSITYRWKYGLKQSDLFDKLINKNFPEEKIRSALNILRERGIIYKKIYIYWFTREYENIIPEKRHMIEEDITLEDIEKENPESEENVVISEESVKSLIENKEEYKMENDYSDIPKVAEDLTKRWKEIKGIQDKLIDEKEKEIIQQKELERMREESKSRQKDLEIKIDNLNKEKERLQNIFEYIRQEQLFDREINIVEKKS